MKSVELGRYKLYGMKENATPSKSRVFSFYNTQYVDLGYNLNYVIKAKKIIADKLFANTLSMDFQCGNVSAYEHLWLRHERSNKELYYKNFWPEIVYSVSHIDNENFIFFKLKVKQSSFFLFESPAYCDLMLVPGFKAVFEIKEKKELTFINNPLPINNFPNKILVLLMENKMGRNHIPNLVHDVVTPDKALYENGYIHHTVEGWTVLP